MLIMAGMIPVLIIEFVIVNQSCLEWLRGTTGFPGTGVSVLREEESWQCRSGKQRTAGTGQQENVGMT